MTLNVREISRIDKKNINFKAEQKQEVKETQPEEPKEEKSFYERNKKALIALGTIGAAAIAIGTHHYIKGRNITKTAEQAADEAAGKMSKKAKNVLDNFKNNLDKLGKDDDATDIIKPILAENNPKLKLEAIEYLLGYETNGKYINSNNWENIFDTLVSLKPSENIKPDQISGNINKLYETIAEKDIATPEVLDKIIAKLPQASDDVKLNLSQHLIITHFSDSKLNREQAKKILDILNNVKQEKFDYHPGTIIFYKDYSAAGVRYHYNNRIFKEAKIDEDYIKDLKNVLNSDKLADDMKLQLMDDIYYNIYLKNEGETKKGIKLIKEMLSAFTQNKAVTYSVPNSLFSFKHDKFDLGCKLFSHANTYDNYNIFTTEEKLKIAQNLKEIAKNVKVNHAELGGNVHNINNIYVEELNLRSKLFFEKLTPKTSIDDLDKFTDEMLNGYKEAKKHFIKGNKVFDEIDEKLLQYTFSHFQLDTYHALMQKRLYCLLKRDFEGIKKINEITDKIEKFGQEHFNTGKSRYYNKSGKTNSSGSKFNFNDFFNDTTKKAKSTLSEFLKKDDALKEFAQIVESDKLDKTVLKNIKRKFAVKYHPDKAKDDAQRAEYTKIFQEINDAIETLEKTLK